MIVCRREHSQNEITIKDLSFKRNRNFKYLRLNIQADTYQEVYKKITAANKYYLSLVQLSKELSRRTKIKLYKAHVRPIGLFASGV